MKISAKSSSVIPSGVFAGAAFGALMSAGLLGERLSAGTPGVAVGVNAVVSGAALLLLARLQRGIAPSPKVALFHLLGAAGGILLVHVGLRSGGVLTPYWLAERPPQLVNDAVAVLSILALVWACARQLDLRLLAFALVVLTAYRSTAAWWHLDLPPHGFHLRVQDIVLAQFVAAALALPLFRQLTRTAD